MNRAALLSFGPSKRPFLDRVAASPTLNSLWQNQSCENLQINCAETLPLPIRTKKQIRSDVAEANKGSFSASITAKLAIAYGKELAGFYKHGVMTVWRNQMRVRQLRRKDYKLGGYLDRKGVETEIAVPSFPELTKAMAQLVYIRAMENKTYTDSKAGELVRRDLALTAPLLVLFTMTRAEYQLLRRTPADFVRLPLFAVIATIFMELTPIFCYAFPEVTPLTCILPSLLPKIWRPQARQSLKKAVTESIKRDSVDDFAMRTAYNLPSKVLQALALCLRLKTKYIPSALFPDSVLRNRLQAHFLYLLVDNYYLSGLNGNGNIWDLTPQELLLACLERNLVEDTKEAARIFGNGTPEELSKFMDVMRLDLLLFIANFELCNVGYLAVKSMLPETETEAVLEWRR